MKFIVNVEGKLLVEAPDQDTAKKAVEGALSVKAPWLTVSYHDPKPITEVESIDLKVVTGDYDY